LLRAVESGGKLSQPACRLLVRDIDRPSGRQFAQPTFYPEASEG
jgi:hypothetical protein